MVQKGTAKQLICAVFLLLSVFVSFPDVGFAQWKYDWNVRTDRDEKPAGIYTTTPFPITESTTTYTIKNDENPTGKTYAIGTITFVDGSLASNCSRAYNPATRLCSEGSYNAYKTIAGAISASSSGNQTILVRDGTYTEVGLIPKSGTDDTHRWMLCGYNQERPVINGVSPTQDTIAEGSATYVTVQRLKVQENYRNGIRTGPYNSYWNVIDVELYNNERWNAGGPCNICGDGNLYFLRSSNMWVFHCTAHRSSAHNFKIGDGGSNNLIEWSVAYEAGYWSGFNPSQMGVYGTNFDFPNDEGTYQTYMTIRYNIGYASMAYALQLRNVKNFSVHHNEFYDAPHFGDKPGAYSHATDGDLVIILGQGANGPCYGNFYSNVIRDPGNVETGVSGQLNYPTAIGIYSCQNTSIQSINMYNNLIYDSDTGNMAARGVRFSGTNLNTVFNFYNNTLYFSNNDNQYVVGRRILLNVACDPDNCVGFGSGSSANVRNNIFYRGGSGACVAYPLSGITNTNNLYYYPSGSRGKNITSETGWVDGQNPLFSATPSGTFSFGMGNIQTGSPAKNNALSLSGVFTTDLNSVSRPQGTAWDIGAYQQLSESDSIPSAPKNLRISN